MTTRPQPNNATPQRLQLAPQNVPRMPFSSPMGEEILSPTSPNASRSPPQHQIKLSQSRVGQENSAGNKWALSSQRPAAGDRERSQEKEDNKSRWPGLNVVTNFSKSQSQMQRVRDGEAKQNAGLGLKKQQGGSIASSRKASVETLGLGHQPSLKTLGSKGRLGDLKRASSKWSNLSPSDRAVMIGISISPEELAQHPASPEASPARPEGLSEQNTIDKRSPNMPAIIVTPAKEKAPWSTEEYQESISNREPRVASSVYSQAPTHNGARVIDSIIVPPIPPLPPDAQDQNSRHGAQEMAKKGPPPRILSAYTEIDDGESPEINDERRHGTGESQLRILTKTSSLDTIATRRRSQGWWNHIVSPFFPKSPMTLKGLISQKPTTDVSTPLKQERSLQEARQTFPPPPKSDDLRSGHTSWTDSTLDREYEKRLELDGFRDRSTMIVDEPQEGLVRDSALLPTRFEGFGAAAEYHEACLYDMYSDTPYFECQNHTCPVSKRHLGEHVGKPNETAEDRGLAPGIDSERQVEQPLAAQQAPTNRFSAAFHEAISPKPKQRPQSDATLIEDLETTPDIEEAHAAPVVRAPAPVPTTQPSLTRDPPPPETATFKAVKQPPPPSEPTPTAASAYPPALRPGVTPPKVPSPTQSPPTPRSNPRPDSPSKDTPSIYDRQPKRYVAVLPPEHNTKPAFEQPLSPGPLSPGQERQAPKGGIVLKNIPQDNAASQSGSGSPAKPRDCVAQKSEQITVADLYPPPRDPLTSQRPWHYGEKSTLPPREQKKHQPLTFPQCRSCFNSGKPRNKKEKKIMIAIVMGLILLILVVLILVMTLTLKKKGQKMPVQAQWLNLTNFPPIPTGVSTIIQSNAIEESSACIQPGTMWSCAVPKEEQQDILPNAPNQPNFRIEIVFQNGTNATANSTTGSSSDIHKRSHRRFANAVSAGASIKNRILRIRSTFSSDHFTPSPAPPNFEDQDFLGNTTDRNTEPFNGEFTPFFMSFTSADKLHPRLRKRQTDTPSNDNSTSLFPDAADGIPPPDTTPNGTAAPANLHPYPTSQPLRLYDRGLETEHYGFYTYFDRSIFLKSNAPFDNDTTPVPDDADGGAPSNAALVRCTWAQTRFLVQIWTKKGNSVALLHPSNSTSTSHPPPSSQNTNTNKNATLTSSSANDFTPPGSFPYPITITLDRHGGDISKKMVYCYGLDERERYNTSRKQFQLEDRGVAGNGGGGGGLINPALGPFGGVNVTRREGGPGGIDGGSGGCGCVWRNWGVGV